MGVSSFVFTVVLLNLLRRSNTPDVAIIELYIADVGLNFAVVELDIADVGLNFAVVELDIAVVELDLAVVELDLAVVELDLANVGLYDLLISLATVAIMPETSAKAYIRP